MQSEQCIQMSEQICKHIIELHEYKQAQNVLLYSSIRNEVDLKLLFQDAIKEGKKVFFPKTYKEEIAFYRVMQLSEMKSGAFGVLEPTEDAEKFVDSEALVIVPGLAFSSSHHRIGFGKGYYDRFLSGKDLYTIGVGYDYQFDEEFVPDQYDIPLNLLISNRGEEHQKWN